MAANGEYFGVPARAVPQSDGSKHVVRGLTYSSRLGIHFSAVAALFLAFLTLGGCGYHFTGKGEAFPKDVHSYLFSGACRQSNLQIPYLNWEQCLVGLHVYHLHRVRTCDVPISFYPMDPFLVD